MSRLQIDLADDKQMWDIWLSHYVFPALAFADEIGLFSYLSQTPSTISDLREKFQLSDRSVEILVSLSVAKGFASSSAGVFQLTPLGQNFLDPACERYWGGMFLGWRDYDLFGEIKNAMLGQGKSRHTDRWKSQDVDRNQTAQFLKAMHSHSQMSAHFLAKQGYFNSTRFLLDVGGGSGCFSLEALRANSIAKATIQELPEVVAETRKFIDGTDVDKRLEVVGRDMFAEAWPAGHDTILLSNVLHDWNIPHCLILLKRAFEALESGGRILIHEILMNDDFSGPLEASIFSLIMLMRTEGRQWTRQELCSMLAQVGFKIISVRPGLHYFSVIEAVK